MTNLIGTSLGRYHILEPLGEGGMAVVYKAFDTRLERNVAIKVILPGKDHTEKFLKRFEREAKSLAGLSHPNIVKVIDYGEHEGLPYLVMEYIPGGTLKQKLNAKQISWQEAVRLIIPIAKALSYAHENKIIHRDVKPANILITQSGEPMLSDFGIAKMVEAQETLDLTGMGVGIGTPEYMSPEQAQGKLVDARADLYSLGVVFYEMVTARKPYQADTPMAVIWKLASEPLPRPKSLVPGLPDFVDQILIKALAKNPEDRFENLSAFANALEKILRDEEKPVDKKRNNPNKGSQRSVILTGILSGFAVLVIGSVGLYAAGRINLEPNPDNPTPLHATISPTITLTLPPKNTPTFTPSVEPIKTSTKSISKTSTPNPQSGNTCETLEIPFTGGNPAVTTRYSYKGIVNVASSGFGQAGGDWITDTFYLFSDTSGAKISPIIPNQYNEYILSINDQPAFFFISGKIPPKYQSDHNYSFQIKAPGGKLGLGVEDGFFADNTGSYTVTLCSP